MGLFCIGGKKLCVSHEILIPQIYIDRAKRGLFLLERSAIRPCFCVCVCLSHYYGHKPLSFVVKFGVNVLRIRAKLHICKYFFSSLPFQIFDHFVGLFRRYGRRAWSTVYRTISSITKHDIWKAR